jgi:hypothetical protein
MITKVLQADFNLGYHFGDSLKKIKVKGAFTIRINKSSKYILPMLVLAMLIGIFLLTNPASASSALSISIAENASQANNYTPNINPLYLNGTGGTLTNGTISGTGIVNITNTLVNTDLYNVTVNFTQGQTSGWTQISGAPSSTATITYNGGVVTVFFVKLGHGQTALLDYSLNPTVNLPLQLNISYNTSSVPDALGQQAVVNLTLTKNEIASGPCAISNIYVLASNALSGSSWTNPAWTFSVPATLPGTNGSMLATGNVVNWSAANMAAGAGPEMANFTATLANTTPFSSASALQLFNMTNDVLAYQISSGTAAGVNVIGSPTAISQNVTVEMSKSYTPGAGYQFIPMIVNNQPSSGSDDITFNLTAVNFWYVSNQNLAGTPTYVSVIGSSSSLPALISGGQSWTGQTINVNQPYVPVGFTQPLITLADTNSQITRTYNSQNGTVTLLQTIYILNGYKIQVTKTVTTNVTITNGFNINITVQNVGTVASPNVYVYDIVPLAWYSTTSNPTSPCYFNNTPMNGIAGTAVASPINGYAYYWNESSIAANSYGLNQTYTVIGTGDYALSQVYVVGVDPAQSLNPQTSPMLNNVSNLASANFEPIAALGALGLIAIGMIGTARRKK